MALSPGTKIGPYEIQAPLGEGGMGAVYRAHDAKLQRDVAIKVLAQQDADAAARLLQEARAASALNHPNICTIHEVGEHDGQAFIVMEYVEGKPLSELIPPDGLPAESVVSYAMQISDALAHAHERGVVHRDLKGQNVVITPNGRAKVLDFGLATRLPRGDSDEVTKTQSTLHPDGALVGTLAYMAPEVLRGESATARTDIWALGVLLYQMGSGQLPFSGSTVAETAASILKESAQPLPGHVPQGLRAVTQRSLAKDSSQRYATTGELRAVLEAIASSDSSETIPTNRQAALPPSIAVLPFTNMSADPEQEYFCDGIAEEITSALAKVGRLRVAGRTSAFSFKGKSADLREIGKTLDVSAVLEGSVRRAGNRLRITAQLVNVADGYHLWSERYDREMEDIFAVQDEIALAVVDALKVTLLGDEQAAVVKHSTEDTEAYQLCLKARHAWYRWTDEGFRTATTLFEQALEKDPDYALAHFGMGDCLAARTFLAREQPDLQKVRAHLETALRLDPDLADAHAVLGGIVEGVHDWNWPSAELRCQRALALNPRSPHVHHVHGVVLAVSGHYEESFEKMRRAVELDPLNPFWNVGLLQSFVARRDWEGALQQARATLDLAPGYWFALCFAGQALAASEHLDEAIAAFEQGVASSNGVAYTIGLLGHALAKASRRDEARRQLDALRDRATSSFVSPVGLALVHAGLGQHDEAFASLERGLEVHEHWLAFFLSYCPTLDDLRPDPRFGELRRRIGLG
ncbi:MAG: protein kinase [Dehalococcoidia bacterium]|nr:protein kinase [Dehalococcoidia bacterium]